ncbi:MAG: M81 family metallopeptidase [Planctomycetales bacterium]|nr:M81 family metallopeptidase [Planctomycetales bacterium]
MRIGILQLWQETNTFNPLPTTRRDFEAFGLLRGPEIVDQLAATNEPGGFIQSLRAWPEQPEIVGLVRLPAWPSGRATAETFDWLLGEIDAALDRVGPLDGLLFALHGALAADGHPDAEGEALAAVRRRIGPQVPLVATFDLHANLTELKVRNADALVGFHTAPHVDVLETGVRAARVLRRILVDGIRPTTAFVKVPVVLPAERANTQDPTSVSYEFRRRLEALEARPDVLTAALATVQPWLDVPDLGSAVVVTTAGDQALADREAEALAVDLWRHRRDYLPTLVPVADAVRQARDCEAGLVVLSDAADATTSGAPGDSTWCFRELLKYDWPRGGALITFVAPEVVVQAEQLGNDATITTPLGGRRDHRHSTPVDITATVENLFAARFTLSGHLGVNLPIDMGRAAVLRTGDVRIICTERSGPHFAPELFRAAGLDPFAAQVLIAKSPCGFRAVYADRAALILSVQAPGCAPADFHNYPYHHRPQPLWPWEEFEWSPPSR